MTPSRPYVVLVTSWIERDVRLWLGAGGTRRDAEPVFREAYGDDAPRRLERAALAVGYLQRHHADLAARGLVCLGERPFDVHLERRFAEALERAIEARLTPPAR